MITDEDINKMKKVFATKDDLKAFETKIDFRNLATKDDIKYFATKDDLLRFATKADLNNFATKDDLLRFATKDDLKQFATKDNLRLLATKIELKKLDNKIDLVDNKLDASVLELLKFIGETRDEIISQISKQLVDFRDEMRDITRIHQSRLNNHETRISNLEFNK